VKEGLGDPAQRAHLALLMATALPPELDQWFSGRGWRLRRHQAEMLQVAGQSRHALLVADTGAGKTLGGFLPTLAAFCPSQLGGAAPPEGLHTLYDRSRCCCPTQRRTGCLPDCSGS